MTFPLTELERVAARQTACTWAVQYRLDPEFAEKLALVQAMFLRETAGAGFRILSGHRSDEKQQQLIDEGRGAAINLSNHTLCPAHAADVWPNVFPTTAVRWTLGRLVTMSGLRWGGCSPSTPGCINQETGLPEDWNHIDDGPASLKARQV